MYVMKTMIRQTRKDLRGLIGALSDWLQDDGYSSEYEFEDGSVLAWTVEPPAPPVVPKTTTIWCPTHGQDSETISLDPARDALVCRACYRDGLV